MILAALKILLCLALVAPMVYVIGWATWVVLDAAFEVLP